MRLGILSSLAAADVLSFGDLKSALELSDGNLSVHARKLEDAGYVVCEKSFAGRTPRTEFRLAPAGRRAFEKYLDLPPDPVRKGIVTFGVVGYIAKGIAVGVAGVLFVVAAVTANPEQAGGLDAALHTLASLPFGPIILWIVGAGLVIYGLFCFARARYARM